MPKIKESVLFRTSASTDIQCSGGEVTVAGLRSVSKRNITAIYQSLYKAEVKQVVTVGNISYTPTGATIYQVAVYDPVRTDSSYTESPKVYKYKTSNDLSLEGVTPALQREYIHGQLVSRINAATAQNHVTAVSLGTGTGFTVTDVGGYYPVFSQSMTNIKGVNKVYTITNPDGTGFTDVNFSVTTPAVYSYGSGANLLLQNPITSFVFGNLISGILTAPPVTIDKLPAVSGQNYDGFTIVSLKPIDIANVTGQIAYQDRVQTIYVDNGTGSSTANLAGFIAFERVMHKLMVQLYKNDAGTVQEWFDSPIVFQDPLGAAPTGTADTLGLQLSVYGAMNRTNIGTQTKLVPIPVAGGYDIDQDDTATEGSHTSGNQQTIGDQSFVVGKTAFSVTARYALTDYTDAAFMIGFRKKAVYGAVINNYTDYGTIGNGSSAAGTTWINGDLFVTRAAINGGATLQAISAIVPADTVSYLIQFKVAIDGSVTAYVNGVSYPIYSVGTTPLVFDAGDEMIPFYQIVNIGSGDPGSIMSQFFAVATDSLIS